MQYIFSLLFYSSLLRSKVHTSNTSTIPATSPPLSLNQPRLHPPSPVAPPPTGTVGTTIGPHPVSESTRPPTAPTLWPTRSRTSRSSGLTSTIWTAGGPSGGATGPAPSSLYPTWAQPAPAPPAPLLGLLPAPITGATPSTGAPPSFRPSGSTWTL